MNVRVKTFYKTVLLSLAALALNIATFLLVTYLRLPVFMDTIFTVALVFYAGLVPALIVAALYNPIMTILLCVIYGTEIFYFDSLYAICGILIVFSTWIFSRNKKEFFFSHTVTVLYLLIIAFVSAFLTSFSASALNTFIRPLFGNLSRFSAIDDFYIAFQNLKFGTFLSYLLPRIPIIVLDRLISTFLGYGIYRVIKL